MLVDSHCHLDRLDLAKYPGSGLNQALDHARERGVQGFLCIAIGKGNAEEVVQLATRYPDVYATVGIHPLEFNTENNPGPELIAGQELYQWLRKLALHPRVLGVGETGLDYYYSDASKREQQDAFVTHLQLAREVNKPVIVHTRDARRDTIALLRQHACREAAGVLHCFTEDWETAKAGLDLGFYVSFSGIITFRNAENLREIAKMIPSDRLLVETDSPYLAPVPHRGRPNEPAYLVEVARCLAGLRGVTLDEIAEITTANFNRLFRPA